MIVYGIKDCVCRAPPGMSWELAPASSGWWASCPAPGRRGSCCPACAAWQTSAWMPEQECGPEAYPCFQMRHSAQASLKVSVISQCNAVWIEPQPSAY